MLDDHRVLEPPDPIPNSDVKRYFADGSVGFPHVRVGHRQAFILNASTSWSGHFTLWLQNAHVKLLLRIDAFAELGSPFTLGRKTLLYSLHSLILGGRMLYNQEAATYHILNAPRI